MAGIPEPSPAFTSIRLLADDDASDTASQRSISLSSNDPDSRRNSAQMKDININDDDDVKDTEPLETAQPTAAWNAKRDSHAATLDTDFSSDADDASSLYTHHTKEESPGTSAAPSVFEESKDSVSSFTLPTYPPRNHLASDRESIASFASTSSRKARPESLLVAPPAAGKLILGIALVEFNHLVGPRIEYSKGDIFEDPEVNKILPFLALPDGAHLRAEDYSYFHVVPTGPNPTTLFGISCNQQIASSALLVKAPDVTRSTVQKAVVVIASKPLFGPIRDKLGVVTTALFQQRDFSDLSILDAFEASLEPSVRGQLTESGLYMGTSIRELVHTFRQRTLLLLKTLILQKRIMFYGHPVEKLCTYQYSLVSLIPGLLQHLDDAGSPPLAARAKTLSKPTSLRTSDQKSMMAYLGLPLDVFGKDALFQPYLPLQQLDLLKETSSWLCGSTNQIVTQQREIDLFINIETGVFEFRDPNLERIVALTPADRKWMDDITRDVNEFWNDADPSGTQSGIQFRGSDDYVRQKFEEYISAALASVKYRDFTAKGEGNGVIITGGSGGYASSVDDFNPLWISEFKRTNACEVWDRVTDPVLFDIVEPRHPCNAKPTVVADIGLRLQEGIQELKLEQQLAPAREAVARTFMAGSANFWKGVEGVQRWNQQRTNSSGSSITSGNSRSSTPVEVTKADLEGSESPPLTARPLSLAKSIDHSKPSAAAAAALPERERKASVSSWGAGFGSFMSSKFAQAKEAAAQMSTPVVAPAAAAATPAVATPTPTTPKASAHPSIQSKEAALPPDPPVDPVSPPPLPKDPTAI